ncbi:MAG: uroporphyrinogen-III synthase [Parvibaculum sp.]|uniref:uroporphyrinogen-III synthase n=1 Tax=Parvibaculum sp. TaxID=2024848 RepID=UPI0032ED1286
MRLLVIRPEQDAAELARLLAARGHQAVIAPVMSVRFLGDAELPARIWQALLVTSANGARALARHAQAAALKDVRVLAVGPASARAMRDAGFRWVEAAEGDVDALAALVCLELAPDGGPLLHVAGRVVAGDLRAVLAAQGFAVERVVLYEAVAADRLPEAARTALTEGGIDGVLLHSPRTARIFVSLVRAAGLEPALCRMMAFCLSQAVADALGDTTFLTVKIAERPEQAALLDLLER